MSKVVKGVGKVFKKVAPIAIGAGLAYFTSGASGALMAGGKNLLSGASGALMSAGKGLLSSAMGGGGGLFGGGASADAGTRAAAPKVRADAIEDMVSESGSMGQSAGVPQRQGGLFDWMQDNPEALKVLAGAAGGVAEGFSEGKRFEDVMEERRRQFDEGRKFAGAFHGRTAGI